MTFGRVAALAVGGDGTIHVLDQEAQQVKVYGPDGAFLRFIGRAGKGPGELSRFANAVLVTPDDRVLVPDYAQARVNIHAPDGSLLETVRLPSRPTALSWVTGGAERCLVFRGQTVSRTEDGRFAFADVLVGVDLSEPTRLDTILPLEFPRTDIGGPGNLRVPLIVNSPFWDRLDDGRLVWGHLGSPEVRIHGPEGRLERIIRSDAWRFQAAGSAEHEVLRELLRTRLSSIGGDPTAANGPNVVLPHSLPALAGVRQGPDGTIWVLRAGGVDGVDPMAVNSAGPAEGFGGER